MLFQGVQIRSRIPSYRLDEYSCLRLDEDGKCYGRIYFGDMLGKLELNCDRRSWEAAESFGGRGKMGEDSEEDDGRA